MRRKDRSQQNCYLGFHESKLWPVKEPGGKGIHPGWTFFKKQILKTRAGKGAGGKESLLGLAESFVLNSRKRGRLVYDFWRKGIQKGY